MPKLRTKSVHQLVVVEPTVIAFAARAGDELQALVLLLPAATAIGNAGIVKVVHRGIERARDSTAKTHVRHCRAM